MTAPEKDRPASTMTVDDVAEVLSTLDGVRPAVVDGLAQWRYRGRVVARQLDDRHVVIRCTFDLRDELLSAFPGAFSVPARFRKHMMVVADLSAGDPGAVEDALAAAWLFQRHH